MVYRGQIPKPCSIIVSVDMFTRNWHKTKCGPCLHSIALELRQFKANCEWSLAQCRHGADNIYRWKNFNAEKTHD